MERVETKVLTETVLNQLFRAFLLYYVFYTYGNTIARDLLTAYDGKTITYDAIR